jgi:microcystin-dependent protein
MSMSDPYIGEIRSFGFNFAPRGWAQCNGQLLSIAQNTALFSILGTTYGGDGRATFALPNLSGAVAMGGGEGSGLAPRYLGERDGAESVTLMLGEMPGHRHAANANPGNGNQPGPAGNFWAQDLGGGKDYDDAGTVAMAVGAIGIAGASEPHSNLQPFQVLNFCIALQGIFPPRG